MSPILFVKNISMSWKFFVLLWERKKLVNRDNLDVSWASEFEKLLKYCSDKKTAVDVLSNIKPGTAQIGTPPFKVQKSKVF